MKVLVAMGKWVAAMAFAAVSTAGWGAAVAGKDYTVINPQQATDSGDKVEVVEVFSYMCPHCFHFESTVAAWSKALPKDVQFRRMPVVFGRQSWEMLAKSYYALEALGTLDKVHSKIFQAIHEENLILQNKDTLFDWIGKQGVDKKKFTDAFDSFAVQGKIQRSNQRSMAYGVQGVPSLIIDGRYLVTTSQSQSYGDMLKTVDELIQMARAVRATKQTKASPANAVKQKAVARK
jgi:protein dithiol oxidoreductase (disulfide-forming)